MRLMFKAELRKRCDSQSAAAIRGIDQVPGIRHPRWGDGIAIGVRQLALFSSHAVHGNDLPYATAFTTERHPLPVRRNGRVPRRTRHGGQLCDSSGFSVNCIETISLFLPRTKEDLPIGGKRSFPYVELWSSQLVLGIGLRFALRSRKRPDPQAAATSNLSDIRQQFTVPRDDWLLRVTGLGEDGDSPVTAGCV